MYQRESRMHCQKLTRVLLMAVMPSYSREGVAIFLFRVKQGSMAVFGYKEDITIFNLLIIYDHVQLTSLNSPFCFQNKDPTSLSGSDQIELARGRGEKWVSNIDMISLMKTKIDREKYMKHIVTSLESHNEPSSNEFPILGNYTLDSYFGYFVAGKMLW